MSKPLLWQSVAPWCVPWQVGALREPLPLNVTLVPTPWLVVAKALEACPWPVLSQDSGPAHLAQVEAVWQGKRSPSLRHPLGHWLLSEALWQASHTLADTLLSSPHASVRHFVGQPLQLARLRLAGQGFGHAPHRWASTAQGSHAWRNSVHPAWVTLADTPATVGSLPELMHLQLAEHERAKEEFNALYASPWGEERVRHGSTSSLAAYPYWVDVCHAWLAWHETHQLSQTLTVLSTEAAAIALSQWWQRRQPVSQPSLLPVVWPNLPLQQQAVMLNHWLNESRHLLVVGPEALHPALWAWEQDPSHAKRPLQIALLYDKTPYTVCRALQAWLARHPHWEATLLVVTG